MLKTYDVMCPDEDCAKGFTIEMEPPVEGEEGELITCPQCNEPWEWEYDAEADTLELLPDMEDDDEEIDDTLLVDEEDDEE